MKISDYAKKIEKYKKRCVALGGAADSKEELSMTRRGNVSTYNPVKKTIGAVKGVGAHLSSSCQDIFDYYDAQGKSSQYALFVMRIIWDSTSFYLASHGHIHTAATMSGTPLLPEVMMGFAAFNEVKESLIFNIMKIVKANKSEFAYPSTSLYVESMPK